MERNKQLTDGLIAQKQFVKDRNYKSKGFTILAIDPSLTAFGYSIICNDKVLTCGCIKTVPSTKKLRIRKSDDRMNRISDINQTLIAIIKEYPINFIVAELPHGSQNANAAISLGLVSGSIQGMSDFLNIGLEWYSEGDCKKALLGKHTATKEETIIAISRKYKIAWPSTKYKQEAIADSIAVYHCADRNSTIIRTMKNSNYV